MAFEILYWHWIVLGIALIVLEIFLPSFTALWFGIGAVIVGITLLIFPAFAIPYQLVLWTILSCLLTWAWFRYFKPLSIDKTKAGLSREAILGEVGQVLSVPAEGRRGTLRFPAPVLGSDEWQFIATHDEINIGDRVRVTDVSGNSLIVEKNT